MSFVIYRIKTMAEKYKPYSTEVTICQMHYLLFDLGAHLL
jgi:hypothetical protein